MKRNLNDDTRQIKKCEEMPVEKKAGGFLIFILAASILLLGYLLFN